MHTTVNLAKSVIAFIGDKYVDLTKKKTCTVGSLYNDDQYCKIAIPHCLIAMGGVGLCFAILSMLSVLCGSAGITILRILSGVTRLVILIWASVEIFGKSFFILSYKVL